MVAASDRLHLHEPRFGCEARAQVIGEWLQEKSLATGRIWALPEIGHHKFDAPLVCAKTNSSLPYSYIDYDTDTKQRIIVEDVTQPMKWNYHVAAFAFDERGEPCIFDPTLFNGVVCAQQWADVFPKDSVRFIQTNWYEAPLHGIWGSHYAPRLQNEHEPDAPILAQIELGAISNFARSLVPSRRHSARRRPYLLYRK